MVVDFSPNIQVPQQAIIDVQGRSPLAEGLTGFTQGAVEGINLNQTIRKLRNRKKAAKLLSQRPDIFGLQEGLPPELLEVALEHPSLLSAVTKHRVGAPRIPFTIDPSGKAVLPPGGQYSAPEIQAYLRQVQLDRMSEKGEQLYNYGRERLAVARTAQERMAATALINAASNIYLQALQPEAYNAIAGQVPGAVNALSGVVNPSETDAEEEARHAIDAINASNLPVNEKQRRIAIIEGRLRMGQ